MKGYNLLMESIISSPTSPWPSEKWPGEIRQNDYNSTNGKLVGFFGWWFGILGVPISINQNIQKIETYR